MKRHLMFTVMVMLIGLLAAGAYAQTDGEPAKEQSRQDGSENDANPATCQANQNHQEYESEKPGTAHDPTGPAGAEAQGDANQGDKVVVTDKTADQTETRNYGEGDGNNHELGENERHGDEFTGTGGPHGSIDALNKDGDLTETRTRNHGAGDGENYEQGETRRHGDEFTGEGGAHGPMGTGPTDGSLSSLDWVKIFGDDADGTFEGDLQRHSWGPGTSTLDGVFGPNEGVRFGPAGTSTAKDDGATLSDRAQRRAGKR